MNLQRQTMQHVVVCRETSTLPATATHHVYIYKLLIMHERTTLRYPGYSGWSRYPIYRDRDRDRDRDPIVTNNLLQS